MRCRPVCPLKFDGGRPLCILPHPHSKHTISIAKSCPLKRFTGTMAITFTAPSSATSASLTSVVDGVGGGAEASAAATGAAVAAPPVVSRSSKPTAGYVTSIYPLPSALFLENQWVGVRACVRIGARADARGERERERERERRQRRFFILD